VRTHSILERRCTMLSPSLLCKYLHMVARGLGIRAKGDEINCNDPIETKFKLLERVKKWLCAKVL